ncbi:MAG: glycosyltransferase, partial [Tepidisphaeraceae bacterium]
VLCEAGSFGVPCLATRVGGIPTIVRDGVNGLLFAPERPGDIADAVLDLMRDAHAYRQLCSSAFAEYRARLNWDVAGRTVRDLLQSLV